MEMSTKQSTLVLLTVAVAVMVISAQVTVILDEKQKTVDVLFGSSLTLYCHLSIKKQGRFYVSWFFNTYGSSFNVTEVINISTQTFNEASTKTKQNLRNDMPKYSLSNVTHKDSGWYFCKVKVEIPFLEEIRSQGAEVVIIPVSHTNRPLLDKWWMWIVLGVSSLVLIVLLIICVLLRRRLRRCRDSECPIYANMRPMANSQPSPRPGLPVDNLKTVSSSQDLRTQSPGKKYDEGKRRHKQ